jgi:hypothetical protein
VRCGAVLAKVWAKVIDFSRLPLLCFAKARIRGNEGLACCILQHKTYVHEMERWSAKPKYIEYFKKKDAECFPSVTRRICSSPSADTKTLGELMTLGEIYIRFSPLRFKLSL